MPTFIPVSVVVLVATIAVAPQCCMCRDLPSRLALAPAFPSSILFVLNTMARSRSCACQCACVVASTSVRSCVYQSACLAASASARSCACQSACVVVPSSARSCACQSACNNASYCWGWMAAITPAPLLGLDGCDNACTNARAGFFWSLSKIIKPYGHRLR